MASSDDGSTLPNPIFWEVKAWIAQKEAYEFKHNKRAPLTTAQRNALEALRLPSHLLPTVGNTNWVGLLNEYRQNTSTSGQIEYDEQESGTVLTGGTKGRICRVKLDGMLLRSMAGGCCFPSPGAGLLPPAKTKRQKNGLMTGSETIPVFATKKMAKQYAAKCAVEFLIKRGYMLENIQAKFERPVDKDEHDAGVAAGSTTAVGSVPWPLVGGEDNNNDDSELPPPSPEPGTAGAGHKRDRREYTNNQGQHITEHGNGVTTIPPPSPKRIQAEKDKHLPAPFPPDHQAVSYTRFASAIEPMSSSSITTTIAADTAQTLHIAIPTNAPKLVTDLCQQLGFPVPRYNITPPRADEHAQSKQLFLFDGQPEFANNSNDNELNALCEYATLKGVRAESQEAMKNVVAGKLLVRLKEIEGERRAILEGMLQIA